MKALKKIVLVAALLVFMGGILSTFVWRTAAVETTPVVDEEITESVPGQATELGEEGVDYDITWGGTIYPGILPDHLLYPLKMVRDRIWLFLTTDSLKKTELYLKFADKRLAAAKALFDNEKTDLGISTLTKAEKYLEKAISQERAAKEAGKETGELLDRLSRATLKHEEIILGFEEKIPDTAKSVYNSTLQYARQGYEKVMGVLGE